MKVDFYDEDKALLQQFAEDQTMNSDILGLIGRILSPIRERAGVLADHKGTHGGYHNLSYSSDPELCTITDYDIEIQMTSWDYHAGSDYQTVTVTFDEIFDEDAVSKITAEKEAAEKRVEKKRELERLAAIKKREEAEQAAEQEAAAFERFKAAEAAKKGL
jgi:hypothetical protein